MGHKGRHKKGLRRTRPGGAKRRGTVGPTRSGDWATVLPSAPRPMIKMRFDASARLTGQRHKAWLLGIEGVMNCG